MNSSETTQRVRGTRWCMVGIWLALAGTALPIISLAGGRLELLMPITTFMVFMLGFLVLIVSGLVTAIGLAISKGTAGDASTARSWGSLAISAVFIGIILSQRPDSGLPPIHDITTDTVNPPQFKAILPLRADAPNPPDYAGIATASQQLAAYPDLVTLTINKPANAVFKTAEQVVRELGWMIIDTDPTTGRIEATDTTTWFRFKDDVVIRLTPHGTSTAIDVRSKSRVGKSDLGANAHRIHAFLDQLQTRATQ
jgi:uncharacterized protein (DUF1499 family)